MAASISCQQLIGRIDEALDGTLRLLQRVEFDGHLNHCDGCAAYVQNYEATITLIRRAFVDDAGEATQLALEELSQSILLARFWI